MNLTVTPEAVDALKQAIAQRGPDEGPATVRVAVAHQCGCGTTKFQMGFDDADVDDSRIDVSGITLIVDPQSAPALEDARLEVVQGENLIGPRFKIETANPSAGGCGCGGGGHQHQGDCVNHDDERAGECRPFFCAGLLWTCL